MTSATRSARLPVTARLPSSRPAQGPAIFGQDVVAEDRQIFSWPLAADVVYVQGDLATVSSYVVELVDSIALTNDLTDSSTPASGAVEDNFLITADGNEKLNRYEDDFRK